MLSLKIKMQTKYLMIFPYFPISIERLVTINPDPPPQKKAESEAKLMHYYFIIECNPREQEWGKGKRGREKAKVNPRSNIVEQVTLLLNTTDS